MELPLFPLNTVLCPGIALPLHIFEDRYRALVRHCLDTTSPFGVVLIREGREVGTGAISFTGIGTIAEIRDAGRYEDGRYDLLVVGTRRFEIRHVLSGKRPYLVAEVDLLDEAVGDEVVAHRLAMTRDPPVRHLPRAAPAALGRDGRRDRRPGRGRDRRRRGRRRDRGRRRGRDGAGRARRRRRCVRPGRGVRPARRGPVDGRGVGRRTLRGPPAPGHDPRRPDGPVPSARRASSRSSRRAARPCSRQPRPRIGCAACSA